MKRKWKPATDIAVKSLKALLLKGYYEAHADMLGELVARIEADRELFKARCQWLHSGKCEYPFWGLSDCDPDLCSGRKQEEVESISRELKKRVLDAIPDTQQKVIERQRRRIVELEQANTAICSQFAEAKSASEAWQNWVTHAKRELEYQAEMCACGKHIECQECMHDSGPCSMQGLLEEYADMVACVAMARHNGKGGLFVERLLDEARQTSDSDHD